MIKRISIALPFRAGNVYNISGILILLFCLIATNKIFTQDILHLSLNQAIEQAKTNSTDYYIAKNKYQSGYWRYRSFKSRLLPFVSASSTLADINNSISKITLPDGSDAFIERRLNNSLVNLSIRQNIFTGGQAYINSGLQRIDLFGDNAATSYLSTPISIGFQQAILSFNSFKWEKEIEPLQFQKSKLDYFTDLESIALKTIELYFNLLIAKLNHNISTLNHTNNDTIYKIAEKRLQKGLITESDLLRLELNLLNSRSDLERSMTGLKKAGSDLEIFLGFVPGITLLLVVPQNILQIKINPGKAKELAQLSNPALLEYNKQELTAQRDLEKAKRENQLNANLTAAYGLTQSTGQFNDIYINPQGKQSFRLGLGG